MQGIRHLLVVLAALPVCSAAVVRAGTIAGVTGFSTNGGFPNRIFLVDTTTGVVTEAGTTPVTPNTLAFNQDNNLYYFGDHDNDDFYVFDVGTGNSTKIADAVPDFGAPAGMRFSGPGEYHNGRYYFVPENNSGLPFAGSTDIYEISFAPDGVTVSGTNVISVMMPSGFTSFGDFGDIAIDPGTGILYGQTVDLNVAGRVAGIFSIDLNSPTPTLTILNDSAAAGGVSTGPGENIQMAFNQDGELFGNKFNTPDVIFPIDTITGAIGTGIPLIGPPGLSFFDVATVGPVSITSNPPVPEPGSLLLIASCLGMAAIRRRGRRRQLNS